MDFTDWTDFLPFVTEKSVTSVQSVSKEIVNRDFKKAPVSEERRLAYGYAAECGARYEFLLNRVGVLGGKDVLICPGSRSIVSGDLQKENASLPQFAFHPCLAAVPLRDGFDNSQPQPGAALHERVAVGAAIELFEQAFAILLRNTDAAVLHGEDQRTVGSRIHMNGDRAPFGSVLDRVFDKVV